MILGLGTDWMEIGRVERELARGEWTPEQDVFTAREIGACDAAAMPAAPYAVCFAAKEAAMKALGVRAADLRVFREVEVVSGRGKGYEVILHDRLKAAAERLGVRRIRLALRRSARQAVAVVILED